MSLSRPKTKKKWFLLMPGQNVVKHGAKAFLSRLELIRLTKAENLQCPKNAFLGKSSRADGVKKSLQIISLRKKNCLTWFQSSLDDLDNKHCFLVLKKKIKELRIIY